MKTLLHLIVLPGLVAASSEFGLRSLLPRTNKGRKFVRSVADCTGIVVGKLFRPDNDISIVSSTYLDSDIVTDILKTTFAEKIVYLYGSLAELNDETYNRHETSTILLENRVNLLKTMEDPRVETWAEYVIVTIASPKWLKTFSNILWSRGFSKVAFIGIRPNGTCAVLSLRQKSMGDMPYLKSFDICDRLSTSNASTVSKINDDQESEEIYRLSSWKYIVKNTSFKYAALRGNVDHATRGEDKHTEVDAGISFLKIFAKKHNFQMEYLNWKSDIKPSWPKLVERCAKGEFDFFYTALPDGTRNDNINVNALDWFMFQSIVLVERVKYHTLPIASLFAPFSNATWYCNIGLTFIFFLFVSAVEILWRRGLIRERLTLLDLWSIFCNVGTHWVPTKFGLRFIFGMWLLRTVIINGSYIGQFSTSMISIDENSRLKTFEDVQNSGRMICAYESAKKFLNDSEDPVFVKLFKRFKLIHPTEISDAIFNQSCITTDRRFMVERLNWINRADRSKQSSLIEGAVIITYPVFFFAKKRHPFTKEFKRVLWSVRTSGLLGALDGQHYGKMVKEYSANTILPPDKQSLHMKHLMPAFQLLFVGLFISTIVLIIEIIVHKRPIKK